MDRPVDHQTNHQLFPPRWWSLPRGFFNEGAYTPDPSIPNDPAVAPDIEALAGAFIQAGGHLDLYPEARAAGNLGTQALLDELSVDRGPVTFVESIEFSRIVPKLDDPSRVRGILGSIMEADAVAGLELAEVLETTPTARFSIPSLPDAITTSSGLQLDRSSTYRQEMLNGFTIGNTWKKEISYDRSWMCFEASAYATFGLGIRIPWEATVTVGPRRIEKHEPDKTPYTANLSIETLDADEDFYRRVGLPSEHLFDGKEAVLLAEAGITLKLEAFGSTIIDRGRSNPLVSRGVDLSKDFDPPLGTTLPVASPELLYEDSGLAYQHWAFAIGGDFKTDIGIAGQNFELVASPYKGWTKSGTARFLKSSRTVTVTAENSAQALEFACDDSSSSDSRTAECRSYHFGVQYSDAQYHTAVEVTPQARLRATLKLSSILSSLSDINLSSPWIDLFTASFDLPALGPHDDTDDTIDAYHRNRRE